MVGQDSTSSTLPTGELANFTRSIWTPSYREPIPAGLEKSSRWQALRAKITPNSSSSWFLDSARSLSPVNSSPETSGHEASSPERYSPETSRVSGRVASEMGASALSPDSFPVPSPALNIVPDSALNSAINPRMSATFVPGANAHKPASVEQVGVPAPGPVKPKRLPLVKLERAVPIRTCSDAVSVPPKPMFWQRPQRTKYPKAMGADEMVGIATQCLEKRDFIMVSLDLEMFEHQHSMITEIGISVINQAPDQAFFHPRYHTFHLIPSENQSNRNGHCVPDNSDFSTKATTCVLSMADCRKFVYGLVEHFKAISRGCNRPLYFVGHSVKGDLDLLLESGFELDTTIPFLDTMIMWKHWFGRAQKANLSSILVVLGLEARFLHNAANDAHITLVALLTMSDSHFRRYYGFEPIAFEMKRMAELIRRAKKDPEFKTKLAQSPDRLVQAEPLQCCLPNSPKLKGKQKIHADSPGFLSGKSVDQMLVEMALCYPR